MKKISTILLYPFAVLYDLLTHLRNLSYDSGNKQSIRFDVPVISVGNLRVGGTGKTPHVEYLIQYLKTKYQIAYISRGYKRKTKGFLLADAEATAKTIGDEPMQVFGKFGSEITVAVGEDRIIAIPSVLMERPETNLVLLDDAFQHRPVQPHFNILLSDFQRPFFKDMLLPAGRLRESRRGAKRADCLIFTKCPQSLSTTALKGMYASAEKWLKPDTPVFFTGLQYQKPIPVIHQYQLNEETRFLVITGIDNPTTMLEYLKSRYIVEKHLGFKDHQNYEAEQVSQIVQAFGSINHTNKAIITTEKDMVKLKSHIENGALVNTPVFYLPVEIFFHADEEAFRMLLLEKIRL